MLFNTFTFILGFLPLTLAAFHALRRLGRARAAIGVLVVASFVFYGWWDPRYLVLLSVLMGAVYLIALAIQRWREVRRRAAKASLLLGLLVSLGSLGYYKYANFFVDNVNTLCGTDFFLKTIVLPIGISFFTFQKIAFLVDVYQGKVRSFNFVDYVLFVMFFPQLIAGPIVHHSEVMPQFARARAVTLDDVAVGAVHFVFGLAKKVLLADMIAPYATHFFNATLAGGQPGVPSAWCAVLAYTAQIYFDFSAYSDMAVGIGLLFGIRLPINFNSPYRALNIVEFWRRWHMTLSRFLRDYLYIPLGGNRKGPVRRHVNLFVTMLLGGIWHGAGWTFLTWGALHGFYLIVNHGWRSLRNRLPPSIQVKGAWTRPLAWAITFLSVITAWVFFRAVTFGSAGAILRGMAGFNGWTDTAIAVPVSSLDGLLLAGGLLLFAVIFPNTQQITGYAGPEGDAESARTPFPSRWFRFTPSWRWAVSLGTLLALCLMSFWRVSEFIYFQF